MAHDLHQVAAGEKFGRIAMGHALLGQEQGRDHDQGHVMVPRLPAADLMVAVLVATEGQRLRGGVVAGVVVHVIIVCPGPRGE